MPLFSGDKIPTIPEFFKNKNVFLTGGSGFIGKVLIEKLLRSCPDIGNIYVLMREKKTKTAHERIEDITNTPVFDLLKKQNGNAIKKIIPINGDICKLGLGISDEDRSIIINEVSIAIHVAASIRFDDPLKKAILYNVRSTVEMINLVKDFKRPSVFAHVSTGYCNVDKKIIEEKLYPAHVDWREAIRLAEEMDEPVLETFTQKYIKPLPNTYTFTKSLAEHVVHDLCKGKIPAIIFRPTVVVPAWKEPVPGWIDNFNGPFAITTAVAIGLMRIVYCRSEAVVDYICVDNIAKSLITAIWEKCINKENIFDIPIYNSSSDARISNRTVSRCAEDMLKQVPGEKKLWAPVTVGNDTACYYYYFINVILFHMIPAILFDGILKLLGKNPLLTKIQRKAYIANLSLTYFMSNTWVFKRERYLGLQNKLLKEDLGEFSFKLPTDFNTDEEKSIFLTNGWLGMKQFLLNESRIISSRTRAIDRSLRILDKTLKLLAFGFMLYAVFWKYNIITYLLGNINRYISNKHILV